MARMIYHTAYRLNHSSVSASALRPIRMLEAFKAAGYDVFELTGTSSERRRKFRTLKDQLKAGSKFDFLYSESATIPAMIGNPNHFPHLFLDAEIFRTVKKFNIPTSVFYRDLYWVYDEYEDRVGRPLATAMRALYRYELEIYKRYADVIFVPSIEMAKEIPQLRSAPVQPLPPGGDCVEADAPPTPAELFYVGGIGAHYRLHTIVEATQNVPEATLTICAEAERWNSVKNEYDINGTNVHVVHARGEALEDYYNRANIAVLAVEPAHYWSFAVPFKLFEYVCHGKPIVATNGTLVAKIVRENGWGWTVDNDEKQMTDLLQMLVENPDEISYKTEVVRSDRSENTWLARARTVKNVLVEE